MSVFICDKTRFKFQLVFSQLTKSYFGKLFRQCRDISEMFLKPFKKLVVRVLSHLKHSATRRVLYVIKHSYSFIKHYLNYSCDAKLCAFLEHLKLTTCAKIVPVV